jgi:hypothetical protein
MTTTNTRIELAAARMLSNWETVFSDAVRKEARRIADEDGRSDMITVSDYNQAAPIALAALTSAVSKPIEPENHGQQKAA